MRNKIKQLLKKEGGFTLVELLAVVAILSLIVGIAVPMIGDVVQKSQVKADNAQLELIVDAARLYQVENKEENEDSIKISVLTNLGHLEKNVIGTKVGNITIDGDTTIGALKKELKKEKSENNKNNEEGTP